jgi:hypothetical protein
MNKNLQLVLYLSAKGRVVYTTFSLELSFELCRSNTLLAQNTHLTIACLQEYYCISHFKRE